MSMTRKIRSSPHTSAATCLTKQLHLPRKQRHTTHQLFTVNHHPVVRIATLSHTNINTMAPHQTTTPKVANRNCCAMMRISLLPNAPNGPNGLQTNDWSKARPIAHLASNHNTKHTLLLYTHSVDLNKKRIWICLQILRPPVLSNLEARSLHRPYSVESRSIDFHRSYSLNSQQTPKRPQSPL